MKLGIYFVCILLVCSFVYSLPSPPPIPGIEQQSNSGASSVSGSITQTGMDYSWIVWVVVGIVVLLILCLLVYYFIRKRKIQEGAVQ